MVRTNISDTYMTLLARRARCITTGAVLFSAAAAVSAQPIQVADLADLSIEELANIEITSVAKRPERLLDAPASIFVITGEDIRRSGATSLAEALRLAPNLQVARANSNSYAISARGFNNTITNKMLVLIDGRTVYSPIFSGAFWDVQDVMLEDVERIEVIDGPGGTLWGANAVNGVINVITRSARSNREGLLFSVGSGNRETDAAMRVTGPLGEDGAARTYVKGFNRSSTETASGASARDAWGQQRAGFRADWGSLASNYTFQGDTYTGSTVSIPGLGPTNVSGSNLVGRWKRQLDGGSSFQLQAYIDHTQRDDPIQFRDEMDIYDIEFQHSFGLAARHRVLWGGGYRYAADSTQVSLLVRFIPADRDLKWGNVFVQDEWSITSDLTLTLGYKVETNVYTGAEYLPSARLAWKLAPDHLLWGAVSRAVRAPARVDREFFFPGQPVIPATNTFLINGGPNFQSEVANVAELGYRGQIAKAATVSFTAFQEVYTHLRSGESPPAQVQNEAKGATIGLEGWATFQATRDWRLMAGFVEQRLHLQPGSADPAGTSAQGNDPEHTQMLRSLLNFTDRHEFDLTVRHVSALPNPVVPAYTAVDARFGWRVRSDLELSLVGQNLFDPGHVEFGTPATASEIPRAVFLKAVWRPER
jgi:iron complex outermembrane receptor protein